MAYLLSRRQRRLWLLIRIHGGSCGIRGAVIPTSGTTNEASICSWQAKKQAKNKQESRARARIVVILRLANGCIEQAVKITGLPICLRQAEDDYCSNKNGRWSAIEYHGTIEIDLDYTADSGLRTVTQ
jgi:hypothetical protein